MTDAPALFAAYANAPSATRYLSWAPRQSVAEVEEWLAPRVARWETGEEYRWVIVDHPDGEAFGAVSLRSTERGYELGYALAMSRSGKGIATSVIQRMLAWVDASPPPTVVTASTDPDNAASSRVLEKCFGRDVHVRQPHGDGRRGPESRRSTRRVHPCTLAAWPPTD